MLCSEYKSLVRHIHTNVFSFLYLTTNTYTRQRMSASGEEKSSANLRVESHMFYGNELGKTGARENDGYYKLSVEAEKRSTGEERIFLKQLKGRRAQLIGHTLRHDSLTKRIIKGKPLFKFMIQIMQDTYNRHYKMKMITT